jgi:hypothetical protein
MHSRYTIEYVHGDLIFLLDCIDLSIDDSPEAEIVGITLNLGGKHPVVIALDEVSSEIMCDMERWAADCVPSDDPADDDVERVEFRAYANSADVQDEEIFNAYFDEGHPGLRTVFIS